jgi:hypothetical protein
MTMPIVKDKDYHRALVESLAAAQAEIERLRSGIQAFLDGDYEPKVKKADKCSHGQYGYESCEACIEIWFQHVLDTKP